MHPCDAVMALSTLASKVQDITAQDFKVYVQVVAGTYCGVLVLQAVPRACQIIFSNNTCILYMYVHPWCRLASLLFLIAWRSPDKKCL